MRLADLYLDIIRSSDRQNQRSEEKARETSRYMSSKSPRPMDPVFTERRERLDVSLRTMGT